MREDWSAVRVLVTGGSKGIGLGIARAFGQAGARVIVTGRDEGALQQAEGRLREDGVTVETLVADVAGREACTAMVAAAVDRLGGLDVLCANAGIYPEEPIEDLTEESVERVLATNLKGTIFSVQAATAELVRSGRGRVVITSSITGPITGYPGLSIYAASKSAQLGFLRSAALELARSRVTVNAVLPGSIRTEGLEGLGEEAIGSMVEHIPQGRLGEVEDIGSAALYFASRAAGFITGQSLVVDGGQTLPEIPGLV